MHHAQQCVRGGRMIRWFSALALSLIVSLGSVARAQSLAEAARQAWQKAAERGDTDAAIAQLSAAAAKAQDPGAASLRTALAEHAKLNAERAAKTDALFQKKLAKVARLSKEGKLLDALNTAAEAHTLAPDPVALAAHPTIAPIVAEGQKQANEKEAAGNWLRALSLFRALDVLFEKQDKYTDHLKRCAHQVGLLRLYAPDVLFELYKKDAAERGDPEPEPWNIEDDNWQKRLEQITGEMVGEGMSLAAKQWVEGTNYEELLIGSIEGLKLLLNSKGLEKTFPSLGDAAKVAAFKDYLEEMRLTVVQRTTPMGYAEASNILSRILEKNKASLGLPEAVVAHEMGDGYITKLDDFSAYYWPHQKPEFERTTRGTLSGVGIQIQLIDRQLTVVSPLEDTPAHKAGIRPGDQITSIDGKSTVGIELDTAVGKITGTEGTKVTLGIKSPGEKEARNLTLTRQTIKIQSIKGWSHKEGGGWDYFVDPAMKIGYIRMTNFAANTADEMDAAVQQMQAQGGLNGLVIDLRFNPGGLLDAAVAISDRFLDSGTIVSTTQKMVTGSPWVARATPAHTYNPAFPLILLINKGSASASEIVSGALQDHHRAILVGERSFGKGSVQKVFRIGGDKALMRLTTQYYRLPDGRIIHRRPGAKTWGIEPDVNVKMTDQQVRDMLEARQLLDILRTADDNFDPEMFRRKPKKDKDKEKAEKDEDEEPRLQPLKSASELLTKGMDPQLETALILLKGKVFSETIAAAPAAAR